MADIRCPMCGKQNPAGLETCQFCHARLKPLRAASPGEKPADKPAGAPGDQDIPDWLSSLRQDDRQAGDQHGDESGSEYEPDESGLGSLTSDGPDWLAHMRSDIGSLEDAGEEEPISPADEVPEWLQRIGTQAEDEPSQSSLDFLSPAVNRDAVSGGPELAPEDAPQDLKDWLSSLEDNETRPAQANQDLPSWLMPEAKTPAGREPAIPDWFSNQETGGPEEFAEKKPESTADTGEKASDLPDWLVKGTRAPAGATVFPAQGDQPEPELPDWLMQPGDLTPPNQISTSGAEEYLPKWLKEDLEKRGETSAPADLGEDLPDWLASKPEDESKAAGTDQPIPDFSSSASDSEALEPSSDLPDWLTNFQPEPVESNQPAPSPDWLDEKDNQEQPQTGEALPEEQTPDWMKSILMSGAASKPDSIEPAAEEQPEKTVSVDSNWLNELNPERNAPGKRGEPSTGLPASVAPFSFDEDETQEDLEPLYDAELPDWLAEITPKESAPQAEEGQKQAAFQGGEAATGLEPAELPSWLEAMRPVETGRSGGPRFDDGDDRIAGGGPLAGLRGVLPAEPDISKEKKLPALPGKIQTSETQQAHAQLFEELVKSEGEEVPISPRQAISTQHILRVTIFVLLSLTLILVSFGVLPETPLPDLSTNFSTETSAASNLIFSLQSGEPVLVAFDYEPGFSGEMNAAAAPVIDHLMLKGAYLTLISTTPTGPLQAERVIQDINQRLGHQYMSGAQYTNLGFLPGGQTGLAAFALTPRQVASHTLDRKAGWENQPLANVQTLENFGLVVVITESPDTARYWIEQVQPFLGSTPLMMVLSAQAEPLVRPYYEGEDPQVQGIVTGLAGGVAYETVTGRKSIASGYWSAFSYGGIATILLIIVGGLVGVVLEIAKRRKSETEGEG